MTEAYPLRWPAGRPRTPVAARKEARFGTAERQYHQSGGSYVSRKAMTVAVARSRLADQLERLGATYPVISSNVPLRADGLPSGSAKEPEDPGVCVYFRLGQTQMAMPCDKWDRVADNMAAIAAHIDALRRIDRYGVQSVEEAFSGFAALPPPSYERPWRDVLMLRDAGVTLEAVEVAYRTLARERHPDQGGSDAMMAELNVAIAAARRELGGQP